MTLPRFTYHPDPLATSSVIAADTVCVCCQQARGYIYTGPVYAEGEYGDLICPWCIADGSAHARLDVMFTDDEGVGGGGAWDEVPEAVVEEVVRRTPGFGGWQQEQWWTHCGDAAQFLGHAGQAELQAAGPKAIAARTTPAWRTGRSGNTSSARCARMARPRHTCSAARSAGNWVGTRIAVEGWGAYWRDEVEWLQRAGSMTACMVVISDRLAPILLASVSQPSTAARTSAITRDALASESP